MKKERTQQGSFRAMHYPLFEYVSHRVPEITDDFYRIDDAMRAGFGWEIGPFEVWDALGVRETIEKNKNRRKAPSRTNRYGSNLGTRDAGRRGRILL